MHARGRIRRRHPPSVPRLEPPILTRTRRRVRFG
jgi:hypothetical protein